MNKYKGKTNQKRMNYEWALLLKKQMPRHVLLKLCAVWQRSFCQFINQEASHCLQQHSKHRLPVLSLMRSMFGWWWGVCVLFLTDIKQCLNLRDWKTEGDIIQLNSELWKMMLSINPKYMYWFALLNAVVAAWITFFGSVLFSVREEHHQWRLVKAAIFNISGLTMDGMTTYKYCERKKVKEPLQKDYPICSSHQLYREFYHLSFFCFWPTSLPFWFTLIALISIISKRSSHSGKYFTQELVETRPKLKEWMLDLHLLGGEGHKFQFQFHSTATKW